MGSELAIPLEREALRANALVRSLLSFARKPGGSLDSVNLAAAVSTAVGLRAHAFAQAGKTLHVDVPPDIFVVADAQKLQHAVVNLINNALDAVVAGEGAGLQICAEPQDDEWVRLHLTDDGPGMADIASAFTPFYTTKEAGKGTGLGLMLVQRFVAEFGGSVAAVNQARGARVTITMRRAAETPASDDQWSALENMSPPPETPPTPAYSERVAPEAPPRQRVLVVDDEAAIREIQRRLLIRAGFDVSVAASGIEARDILLHEQIDLVVTDLRMPGEMDGNALLEWLQRERPHLAETAMLATGDVTGEASIAFPLPPERILNKPFVGAEFVQRVRTTLGVDLAAR